MDRTLKILHLEDDIYDVELIHETLQVEGIGCEIIHVFDREGFLSALEESGLDLILADFKLPSFNGQEALALAKEKAPALPFIFVSGAIGEELAIETLKQGATDYVLKHRLSRLVPAIQRALREVEERNQRRQAQEELRQSNDQLQAILSGITEGITVRRPQGKLIYANETAAQITGYPSAQAMLDALDGEISEKFDIRDESNRPFPRDQLPGRLALQGLQPSETLIRLNSRDGRTERWLVANATPIFDTNGRVLFAVNIFRDLTERTRLYVAEKEARENAEAAARRIASLQEITAAFSKAMTPKQVAQIVLEHGLGVLGAAAGSIVLLNSQENMLHVLHSVGYSDEVMESWRQFPLDAPAPLAETVRTGEPIFLETMDAAARFSGLSAYVQKSGNKSWISIPLVVEEHIIGAMGLSFNQPQVFPADDREFILALGGQCAQALERTRLFEAEQLAREEATRLNVELEERVRERTADLIATNSRLMELNGQLEEEIQERFRAEARLLLQVRRTTALVRTAAILNADLDLAKVLMAVCEEAASGLQIDIATVSLYDPAQDALVHAWGHGLPDDFQNKLKPLPLPVYEAFIRDKGPLVVIPDLKELNNLPNLDLYRSIGACSMASVSLVEKGRLIGRLLVASLGEVRQFGEHDIALLHGLADQSALAIQNARLLQEVRNSRSQLRRLTKQLVNTQEEERRHLSLELHDGLGQVLTVLKITLEMMRPDMPPNNPSLSENLQEAINMADDLVKQMRNLAYDLRPLALDALGLNRALEAMCNEFTTRTKIDVKYTGIELPHVPETISVTFYRLLQEALTNVARHSQSRTAQVELDYDSEKLTLCVADNGQGFDLQAAFSTASQPAGLGLLGMKERIELLGGSLEIDTRPGRGTRLTASTQLAGS